MSDPRFLLDEHVWGGLVNVGQEMGGKVLLVQTQLPEGTDDESENIGGSLSCQDKRKEVC